MLLSDDHISSLIDEDHNAINLQMASLGKHIKSSPLKNDFGKWKLELRRSLVSFLTLLNLHFELEEDIGFKNTLFLGNADHLKSIKAFKIEHSQIRSELEKVIELQLDLKANDELHRMVMLNKFENIVHIIQDHEKSETLLINETIKDFKKSGRFDQSPTHSIDDLKKWEKELGLVFPAPYKKAVSSGSYDKATFHFIKPELHKTYSQFLIFATWNDVQFGFDTQYLETPHTPISVLVEGFKPENKYSDFTDWFHLVLELANQPVSSG